MSPAQETLARTEVIGEKYIIQFFIKKNEYSETYRVKDTDGELRFLKLLHLSKLHRGQFISEGKIKEIEILKVISHPNLVQYRDDGEFFKNQQRYVFIVFDFISGESPATRLMRQKVLPVSEVKQIAIGVLNSLKYLHNLSKPVVHNAINHQSVIIDLGGQIPIAKLSNFGHASYAQDAIGMYNPKGLNPYYLASECFNNIFSFQSDLYSVGTLIYHLITGLPPWFVDQTDYQKDRLRLEDALLKARHKPLKLPALPAGNISTGDGHKLLEVANRALNADLQLRFRSAEEMLEAIYNENAHDAFVNDVQGVANKDDNKKLQTGGGFADIAGMDDLKDILNHDVIRALEDKDLYEAYGLTIPNGMLLYGPPGCGKSFFAQKLAEQVGYNYVQVTPSELASIYVHGSQEKIGQLFKEARTNAPTILNFEEFDALVPKRDSHAGRNQSGEVNEFLTQLNNCGKDGVFVIASTNQPELIDPAVLRAGRIDKVLFVPPPDYKAREEMFRMLLQKRPIDFGVKFEVLANMTVNYVSADIEHIVNEASRMALRAKSKITQFILEETIKSITPSVKHSELERYDAIRAKLEGLDQPDSRRSIGFHKRS